MIGRWFHSIAMVCGGLAAVAVVGVPVHTQQPDRPQGFRFRSGVELINVTATVSDRDGRFVSRLDKDDFLIYEDDQLQEITHFSTERVPVSLGIALDTSGSMVGEKMRAAQSAIDRFLYDLLDPADEIFIYRFSDFPALVQAWTTDRDRLSRALRRVRPRGGTAMYDAVADAVPIAQSGRHRKQALVIISDGNDTSSETTVRDLKQLIRETEVLVYAIGLDARARRTTSRRRVPRLPLPFPIPGIPGGGGRGPTFPPTRGGGGVFTDERVNQRALRELTDDSGGRTEIVRSTRDLDPATASVADELSKQYYLGYPASSEKDGRWHTIRVEVKGGDRYVVRARRGYVASP